MDGQKRNILKLLIVNNRIIVYNNQQKVIYTFRKILNKVLTNFVLTDILIDVSTYLGDQLSWLEHLPYKQGVTGSSPISPTIFSAEIAQLVEQLICNQQVPGSSPGFGTIFFEISFQKKLLMEEYPSLAEGTGLENQEVEQSAQGFESLFLRHLFIF